MTPVLQTEMLCAWCAQSGRDEIRFEMYPWDPAFCREVGRICETYSASAATQCKILRWDRFADALLRLKRTLMPLPAGRVVLGIGGFGALAMEVGADCTQVTVTTEVPAVSVDALTAARMLSGTLSPVLCAPLPDDAARLLGAWLPLPFSWNGQDRV